MPCAGTAGTTTWSLTAHGKMGHSGLPHNAINPIILANEAVNHIMERFHADFPKHEKEQLYNFRVPSTMKRP
jgi:acetylornithine deacetylase